MSSGFPTVSARPGQEWALASYLTAIKAHKLVVALVALTAVAASVVFLQVRSPEYEATADILVEPLPLGDQSFTSLPLVRDTGDPARTVQTAAALIETPEAARRAERDLGRSLAGAVEVNPVGESNILGITARAETPQAAADAANAFATAALDQRNERLADAAEEIAGQLEERLATTPASDPETRSLLATRVDQVRSVIDTGDPTMFLAQEATPPTSAVGASSTLVLALTVIVGFTLGAGTAVLLELTTRRVRDEAETLALYPLPILTRVPLMRQRRRRAPDGSSWYMPPLIREAFRTLAVQLLQRGRPPRSILVTSATRGDGKSTSSINLAVTLAGMGRPVILLDFDLRNPQVGSALGLAQGSALHDLIDPNVELDRLLIAPFEFGSLHVLPVRFDEDEAPLIEAALAGLPRLVEQARGLADDVIVDTPPLGEVSDALNLASIADEVVLVTRPGNTNRSQLGVTGELLERIDVSPLGYVMIGSEDGLARSYYGRGYGAAARDLVISEVGEPPSSADRVGRSSSGGNPSPHG